MNYDAIQNDQALLRIFCRGSCLLFRPDLAANNIAKLTRECSEDESMQIMIPLRRAGALFLWCMMLGCLEQPPAFSQTAPSASGTGAVAGAGDVVGAQETTSPSLTGYELQEDAWWTGPMLANSAGTLPPGHLLLEPYLYDVSAAHSNSYGSRTYVLYGLANRLTVGMIPAAGYNMVSTGASSSGVGMGDLTLLAQYQLTQFHQGSWIPTTSIEVQETFPTGQYDQLGNRPTDGFGSGAYTTTLQFNSQTYFWLPNGRILRMRFDLSQAFSNNVNVDGVSVYDTGAGFRGTAKPGSAFSADAAWEYSMTRNWVLALDVTYSREHNTLVTGYNTLDPNGLPFPSSIRINSGSSVAFGFAPAIEYNWNSSVGVLFGTRVIVGGHNTETTVTPAVALNVVY